MEEPTSSNSNWTYPTRKCRLCFEEVTPTVTVSNPSLPAPFRTTVVTYTSEDGGRLIKPCRCKGSRRYIHEGCLAAMRANMARDDAFKQCDICRYQYNTNRLLFHDVLRSRVARMFFTILLLLVLMFVLGFIADPIINLYIDPYETMSSQRWLEPVTVSNLGEENEDGWWIQHFMKGFVSIGIAGFLKTVLLSNPWNFWNFRHSGLMGGTTRTSATGRDRAVNISWIALLIGVGSALYLLYDQVRKFAEHTLHKVAVRVIELQMDDDDDDLIPPAGVGVNASQDTATGSDTVSGNSASEEAWKVLSGRENVSNPQASPPGSQKPPAPAPPVDDGLTGYSSDVDRSKLDDARAQTWSFKNIEGNGNP